MAFVDTLLTEQPNATVAIVDKHNAPGGHWNDAYGFVRLHQPSLLYGVASKQLEGRWSSLLLRGILPWTHRASKHEILTHYKGLMDDIKMTHHDAGIPVPESASLQVEGDRYLVLVHMSDGSEVDMGPIAVIKDQQGKVIATTQDGRITLNGNEGSLVAEVWCDGVQLTSKAIRLKQWTTD